MAMTISHMVPMGTKAPDFSLPDTISGKRINLYENRGKKGTLVMFICNHCPYVKHLHSALGQLGKDYSRSGIAIFAISSNDIADSPEDAPMYMKAFAKVGRFNFPYLYDESQDVAKKYHAACTPDFFLFNDELRCVYHGQFDDSRPDNDIPVTGKDLRKAMDALKTGKLNRSRQKLSVGCNIKWKVNPYLT